MGLLCSQGQVSCIIVGADRIAMNGDFANKIGTYTLAILASVHEIPFYVAAPTTTIDRDAATGLDIPIEERDTSEVLTATGLHPKHGPLTIQTGNPSAVFNPVFDITPGAFVKGIITEKGIVAPDKLKTVL